MFLADVCWAQRLLGFTGTPEEIAGGGPAPDQSLTKEINVFLHNPGGLLPVEDSAEQSTEKSAVMTVSLAPARGGVTP